MSSEVKTFWENEKEIITVEKNKSEKIKVIYGERQNKKFFDIRINKTQKDGKNCATFKGVAIPLEEAIVIAKKILIECEKLKVDSNNNE